MPFLLIMPSSFNAAAAVFEIVPNFRTFKCRSSRPVVLVGIDDELVVDGNHLGRSILLDTVELHLHATQIVPASASPLDALDHASGNRGQEQFSGIEASAGH